MPTHPLLTALRAVSAWAVALLRFFPLGWLFLTAFKTELQAIAGQNLFGSPVPTSIAQLWIPRVELHLIYNTIVFIPMMVAMYYHMFPPKGEAVHMRCTCAVQPRVAMAT